MGPLGRARIRGGGTTGRRVDARVTETTEDEDQDQDEDGARRREAKREIGHLAVWSVASAKPGNGVELLRDDDLGTFWQSDGAQPHLVSAQFQHKAEMCEIALWCEYKMDESYTPSLVSVRAGTSCHDLREVRCVELEHPNGWVRVPLGDAGDASETALVAGLREALGSFDGAVASWPGLPPGLNEQQVAQVNQAVRALEHFRNSTRDLIARIE